MSITGPGSITAANLTAQTNMFKQLNTLSQELGTGDASQTYSGLGSRAGVASSLESQIAAFNAYSTTASTVGTTLTLAQSVLTQLDSARTSVQQALNQQNAFSFDPSRTKRPHDVLATRTIAEACLGCCRPQTSQRIQQGNAGEAGHAARQQVGLIETSLQPAAPIKGHRDDSVVGLVARERLRQQAAQRPRQSLDLPVLIQVYQFP